MLAGASYNEIALVVFLVAIVVVAPKVGKIGEAIGGFLGGAGSARPPGSGQDGPGDEDAHRD